MPDHAAKRWCFTLNNYTQGEFTDLKAWAETNPSYIVIGIEQAGTGTPHLQGFFVLRRRRRLAQVKEIPGLGRAHFEVTRGTNEQASTYCKKEHNYWERGDLCTPQGKRTDWERFKDWATSLDTPPSKFDIASTFPSLYARYPRACREFLELFGPSPILLDPELPLRPWQQGLYEALEAPPDDRKIIFITDTRGNTGKSWFVRWYMFKHPEKAQRLSIGRREDLAFAIDVSKSVFFFDIPRGQSEFMQYSVYEQLKDGLIFSSKYESGNKVLHGRAHVVIFMNEQPDRNKLSADRYQVTNLLSLN